MKNKVQYYKKLDESKDSKNLENKHIILYYKFNSKYQK